MVASFSGLPDACGGYRSASMDGNEAEINGMNHGVAHSAGFVQHTIRCLCFMRKPYSDNHLRLLLIPTLCSSIHL